MTRAIETIFTNEDKGYQFGSEIEPLDDTHLGEDATLGEIFRACQENGFGRCTSKVYIDTPTGVEHIGWFFVSRQEYEDTHEPYLRGVWVTVGEYVPAVNAHLTYEPMGVAT